MKTLTSIITAQLLALAMAVTVSAQAPGKGGWSSALRSEAAFKSLEPGSRLALVCKASDSIQIIDVSDEKHALRLCKEGQMVNCPECKKSYKVSYAGNPAKGQQTALREMKIVNEKGEPCMFYARIK